MENELKRPFRGSDRLKRKFSNEAFLQQAIAGLLERMPDVTGVQISQGAHELGKDLIFDIRGGFGEQILCACVIKNKKITGDVASSSGARTILFQAQQAFDSPHTDGSGLDKNIGLVYVVTPFELQPSTINSIKGALKERSGQVKFIGGPQLFDLFNQYWPDFLADEADFLEQHLKFISNTFEDAKPLPDLSSRYHLGTIDTSFKKVYVTQVLHRELHSYTLGDVLTKSIPTENRLQRRWNRRDLNETQNDLKKLYETLLFLKEWDYLGSINSKSGEDVIIGLTNFKDAIESDWKNSMSREYRVNRSQVGRLPPDAHAPLHNFRELVSQTQRLEKELKEALKNLEKALKLLSEVVDSSVSDISPVFSHIDFTAACHLDDCAHAAAPEVFEPQRSTRIRMPKDTLERWSGSLIIVGAAGFGKTSFCRWNAFKDVERFSSGQSDILPVYIQLHRLGTGELTSFEDVFLGSIGRSALLAETEEVEAKTSTRIRLYLDGLDEIASATRREEVVALAKQGARDVNKYQVIITARDHVQGSWLSWLSRVSLSGFDDDDVSLLVSKWLDKSSSSAHMFFEQLRDVPSLKPLMQTPLLATLVILVFRQTGRLPESKTRLYEIFINLLSGGWDMAKGILRESKFDRRTKEIAITDLAIRLHEKGKREFDDREMRKALEENFSRKFGEHWESLRNELVEDGLITRSGNTYQFPHLSFQEFLTAKGYLGDPQPRRVRRALDSFLSGNNWWREVLRFYTGLSAKPREITLWLLTEIDRNINKVTVTSSRIDDLLAGVAEAFPEFPIEDYVDRVPKPAKHV